MDSYTLHMARMKFYLLSLLGVEMKQEVKKCQEFDETKSAMHPIKWIKRKLAIPCPWKRNFNKTSLHIGQNAVEMITLVRWYNAIIEVTKGP